jgi:hypothetical protein
MPQKGLKLDEQDSAEQKVGRCDVKNLEGQLLEGPVFYPWGD